mgnify:CR=1 FL=1
MKSFIQHVRQFLVSEDGPTAVEYAVMLALIVVVCLAAISAIGTNASTTFNSVSQSLSNEGCCTVCSKNLLPSGRLRSLRGALS